MVTDTAFPMEPSKQCKRRTNVHYQSEILHKIPIQDQQGSSGWHSSLGEEHTGRFHSASYFLSNLHQMKTITGSSNRSFVQIICLKPILHFAQEKDKCSGRRCKQRWNMVCYTSWLSRSLWMNTNICTLTCEFPVCSTSSLDIDLVWLWNDGGIFHFHNVWMGVLVDSEHQTLCVV